MTATWQPAWIERVTSTLAIWISADMKCDVCKEQQATIEFTAVAGDEKKTLHLCAQCSKQESLEKDAQTEELTPSEGSQNKKLNAAVGQLPGADSHKGPCSGCGMTYEEFRKIGRLGCSKCYEAFEPALRRLLKRIHGSEKHVGRGPRASQAAPKAEVPATEAAVVEQKPQNLEQLQQELQAAVDAEEYERAAGLRDRVARLQRDESS
jgi:protein arginine kinase activator